MMRERTRVLRMKTTRRSLHRSLQAGPQTRNTDTTMATTTTTGTMTTDMLMVTRKEATNA